MEYQYPYNESDLRLSLASISKTALSAAESSLKEVEKEIYSFLPQSLSDAPKHIAKENSMTVEDFLKSPNLKTLCQEWLNKFAKFIVQKITEKGEITEIQAWAIIAHAREKI